MEKKRYTYPYSNINLRASVAKRFRIFSKKVASTHTETITEILDFFEWHNYSPHQRFAKDLSAGQELNRKRIEAHIAISKSIEKAQNVPIANIEMMLRSLFEEELQANIPEHIETEITTTENDKKEEDKNIVPRIKFDKSQRKLSETKERLQYMLHKIQPVSNRFGKDFLKIDITTEEWARFKQNLKDS